jgi:hypothetical protein
MKDQKIIPINYFPKGLSAGKNPASIMIFIVLVQILLGCSGNNKTVDSVENQSVLKTVHPRYLEIPVPSGNITVQTNPPILRWPNEKGKQASYEVRLSQDSLFQDSTATISAKSSMAIYNPHRELNTGKWYWQFRKTGGGFSKTLSFVVDGHAVNMVSPAPSDFLRSIPEGHPRVLLQAEEANELFHLESDPDAQAIITEAKEQLQIGMPKESEAYSKRKLSNKNQQRKLDLDASQNLSSKVYKAVNSLAQAYVLTGNQVFSEKAISLAMEVSSWDAVGVTRLSDFGDSRCMLSMALVFDTFYDQLNDSQKKKLIAAISQRAEHFYHDWVNDIESKILSGHVWQHILHYFFQTALALHGEVPEATDWLTYAYELFLARAPVLGGFDGGWAEGASYFRMNMETMLDIPLFIQKFTGFDFINAHPWYAENIKWMVYHVPPGSSADGFSDNSEEVRMPGAEYMAYAEEMAKLTGNRLAAWYASECRKYENLDLSQMATLRWIRLAKTRDLSIPETTQIAALPMGAVFRDMGLAALHINPMNTTTDLMVAFKSSPLGAYGHLLCDQNTFNILYGGMPLFYRTGYKVTMDDPHRTGWYRTTKSQNGILINGEGQPYSSDSYGWISRFVQGDEIAYIKGDATNAYKSEDPTMDSGIKKIFRHIILLKPDLVIVYDELVSREDVQWSWLIHSLQEMNMDTVNHTFSTALPNVKGVGKMYQSQSVKWELADTSDVPAINWRNAKHTDGTLKTYDAPQYHLKISPLQKNKSMRFLAILQVSPNADLDRVLYNSQLGENGDLDITVGEWNIAASLNPNLSPELIIRKTDGNSTLTIYPKDVEINGRKLKGKQANSSLLAEKKNGKTTIQEVVDAMPHAMKNVILYHR